MRYRSYFFLKGNGTIGLKQCQYCCLHHFHLCHAMHAKKCSKRGRKSKINIALVKWGFSLPHYLQILYRICQGQGLLGQSRRRGTTSRELQRTWSTPTRTSCPPSSFPCSTLRTSWATPPSRSRGHTSCRSLLAFQMNPWWRPSLTETK